MPTYQYACTACGHRFEAVQSFSDSSLTDCPECAGRLRKVFSSVGIVFKGSGFYRTDSRARRVDGTDGKESADKEKVARRLVGLEQGGAGDVEGLLGVRLVDDEGRLRSRAPRRRRRPAALPRPPPPDQPSAPARYGRGTA